jgi:hypothetical protein
MTYDASGRWTRTDRPEMLSDRLGNVARIGSGGPVLVPAFRYGRHSRAGN